MGPLPPGAPRPDEVEGDAAEGEAGEVWALCRAPRHRLFRLRYTLEAYEGLCLSTTAPGGQGLVWVRTSRGLRRDLQGVLSALADEMDLQILDWGTGPPRLPAVEVGPDSPSAVEE